MSINDKIKQVLTIKQLSPSQLADDIGVQRSSISHILSGRNRPSLDIIQKIVRAYPDLSYEWFLEDDSQLSTSVDKQSRVQSIKEPRVDELASPPNRSQQRTTISQPDLKESVGKTTIPEYTTHIGSGKQIDRILIFYNDGTFLEYKPA